MMKFVFVIFVVVCFGGCLNSCGGSGSSVRSTSQTSKTRSVAIPDYGHAANTAETEAITALIKRYYAAAAADDGAAACSLIYSPLSESVAEDYGQPPGPASLSGKTCKVVMSKLFRHLPEQSPAVLAGTEVTGVRVKGRKGYALLRSKAIPAGYILVERELGMWKVGTIIGAALPGTKAPVPQPGSSKTNTHFSYEDAGTPKVKDADDGDGDPTSNDDESIVDYGHAASPADEQVIATLVKRYYAATSAANGGTICSLIYNVVVETIPEDYEASSGAKGATCAEVMAKVFARRHRQVVRELSNLRVTRVRVEGAKGIAIVHIGRRPDQHFFVHRQGAAWKMDTLFVDGMP